MRVGINFGNALLTARDESGSPRGIAVDLALELTRRAGVSMDLVSYDSAGRMADGAKAGEWDVAFLATDPARAEEIVFSQPYLEIDTTYLVWSDSSFLVPADVDSDGVRISVSNKSAYDLFLTRALKSARLVRTATPGESVELFFSEKLEALGGLRPLLIDVAEKHPGTRVLDGGFMTVRQAIGVPNGQDAAARYVREFVEDIKASGLVAAAIERNKIRGASVAPLSREKKS
jgi:polar amino acid transport system substrate-binding protein